MNNSALKLFHELMKKGWIDRNDNSLMWNLVEDNEARDELDQMGIELGFEIIQAQDRIYMVPTQDNDLFLKNNVDYRADIKATNEVRSRDLYLMNYLAIYILFIFFKGEGVDALTRDFTTKEELIKEFTKHCQDVTRDDIDKDDKTDDYSENFHMLAEDWLSKKEGEITSKRIDDRYGVVNKILLKFKADELFLEDEGGRIRPTKKERETYEKTRDSRQDEYTDKKGDYIAAEQEVKHAQEALAEHEGIPLPQEEIGEAFKERLSKAREEIKRLRSRLNILENEKRSLEKISYQVNSELEGYSEGIVAEGTILSANPDEQWKTLKAKLIFSKTEYTRKREELYRKIQTTVTTYKDIALAEIVGKLNAIGGMIDATEIKGDRLFTISESITAMIESIRKINSKIETDLREITNDFNDLVEQCFLQGKRVYEDLRMIASSSKAHIYDGKPQIPMLKMDLPEEMELSEEASRMSIRNEIEKGANEIKEMLVNNFEEKQIQKRAKSIVGSERLLHKYIIRETVPVKV